MNQLPVIDPYAAFVDVGSEKMFVSVAGAKGEVFGSVTPELHKLAKWLQEKNVHSVAMEATGVYWLPLYNVLEKADFEVIMVNGRQTKNLPGRKTDMQDCEWGATLHAHGLLQAGFVPPAEIRILQDYLRLRADHVIMAASHVQHMQKALERMNIKVHDVLSSLTGASGLAVVRAILDGERDPHKLWDLCDKRVKRSKNAQFIASLQGTWSEEHLFALKQAVGSWDHYQKQIVDCDMETEKLLKKQVNLESPCADQQVNLESPPCADRQVNLESPPCENRQADLESPPCEGRQSNTKHRKKPSANAPNISDLHNMVIQLCHGRDLTQIPGFTDYSLLMLISEVGTDLSKWATEKQFTAWLGLAPGSHQSGKRHKSVKRHRGRPGRLFCQLAQSSARSNDSGIGGFYRRMASRRGGLIATMAVARKLAVLFWRSMVQGLEFVEKGLEQYNQSVLNTKARHLKALAKELGQELVPIVDPVDSSQLASKALAL